MKRIQADSSEKQSGLRLPAGLPAGRDFAVTPLKIAFFGGLSYGADNPHFPR